MKISDPGILPYLRRAAQVRKKIKIILGICSLLALAEGRNRAITRLLRALKRGLTAAVASYIEERGGMKLFTLDDELPPEMSAFASFEAQLPPITGATRPPSPSPPASDGLSSSPPRDPVEHILSSAKLFACMDLEGSRKLYEKCTAVQLAPGELLFSAGDPSSTGAYIVFDGQLGVYLDQGSGSTGTAWSNPYAVPHAVHIATLHSGQSVGDIDIMDGAPRTVTCRAMETGCRLVQMDRDLFLRTVVQYPRVLQSYLNRYIARLWRVGHFTLHDFLQLPLEAPHLGPNSAQLPNNNRVGLGGQQGTATSSNIGASRLLSDEQAFTLAEAVLAPPGEGNSNSLKGNGHPSPALQQLSSSEGGRTPPSSPGKTLLESLKSALGESSPFFSESNAVASESEAEVQQNGSSSSYHHWRAMNGPSGLKGVLEGSPGPTAAQTLMGAAGSSSSAEESSTVNNFNNFSTNLIDGRPRSPLPPRPSSASSETTVPPSAFSRFMQPLQGILRSSKPVAAQKPITKSQRRVSFSEDLMAAAIRQQSTELPAPTKAVGSRRTSNGTSPVHLAPAGRVQVQKGARSGGADDLEATSPQLPSETAPSLPVMLCTHYASLAGGWDVVAPEESGLGVATLVLLTISVGPGLEAPRTEPGIGRRVSLAPGEVLYNADLPLQDFYVLLEGHLVIERSLPGKKRTETALVAPGSLVGGASFLTSTHSRSKAWAAGEGCLLAAVGQAEIEGLVAEAELLKAVEQDQGTLGAEEGAEGTNHAEPAMLDEDNDDAESVDSMYTAQEGSSRPGSASSSNSMLSAHSSIASAGAAYPPSPLPSASPSRGPFSPLPPLPASTPSTPPATTPWEAIPEVSEERPAHPHFSRTISNQSASSLYKDASLQVHAGAVVADLLLAASRALGPVIRQFISLGLSRTWHRAGEVIYRTGEPAEALYIVISGRARLLHSGAQLGGGAGWRVEDEVGRGESMGAVWVLSGGTHDTTCLCVRDVEAVRMSKASFEVLAASRPKAAARLLQGMAARLAAAGASRRVATSGARTAALGAASSAGGVGAGRRGDIATIAILPAGGLRPGSNPQEAVAQLARALRSTLEASSGRTTLLDFSTVQAMFPTESQQLEIPFFRAKVTTWLSQKEEDCRFIILQGDASDSPWTRICADQADCILLTAAAEASPEVSIEEEAVVWRGVRRAAALMHHAVSSELDLSSLSAFSTSSPQNSAFSGSDRSQFSSAYSNSYGGATRAASIPAALEQAYAGVATASASAFKSAPFAEIVSQGGSTAPSLPSPAALRRVELVLLHYPGPSPIGTAAWLDARPLLTRHHHVDLFRLDTVERLGRWMAGTAVGVVLSGGGSRGLAHLGILRALQNANVPIDVVGGTSQGAMIAGMFAQDVGWSAMHANVRAYAAEMGSARRLIADLTLPLLSVFTGAGLDSVVKQAFSQGPQRIEDLWIRFFCVTTNLTLGAPSVHQRGLLWRAVRASMTLIGLVPPVLDEFGHLLCDGGYSDNLPVAAMRDQVGVGSVIVVDVEDRDQSAWHNLSTTDGGVSGWQLLWDRICPVERWRFGIRMPGHAAMMNALTWMAHKQNLARLAQEGQQVDLYLRPPVTQYRLMDYHLADRIVRDASRYAFVAVADWQRSHGGKVPGQQPQQQRSLEAQEGGGGAVSGVPIKLHRRSASVGCMTQLQAKQAGIGLEEEESSEDGASVPEGLLAPIQLLTRAATAHPELAIRFTGRLASLQQPTQAKNPVRTTLIDLPEGAELTVPLAEKFAAGLDSEVGPIATPLRPEMVAPLSPGSSVSPRGDESSYLSPSWHESSKEDKRHSIDAPPPASSQVGDGVTEGAEDQFKYLENIHIEFEEDDLPWG